MNNEQVKRLADLLIGEIEFSAENMDIDGAYGADFNQDLVDQIAFDCDVLRAVLGLSKSPLVNLAPRITRKTADYRTENRMVAEP